MSLLTHIIAAVAVGSAAITAGIIGAIDRSLLLVVLGMQAALVAHLLASSAWMRWARASVAVAALVAEPAVG